MLEAVICWSLLQPSVLLLSMAPCSPRLSVFVICSVSRVLELKTQFLHATPSNSTNHYFFWCYMHILKQNRLAIRFNLYSRIKHLKHLKIQISICSWAVLHLCEYLLKTMEKWFFQYLHWLFPLLCTHSVYVWIAQELISIHEKKSLFTLYNTLTLLLLHKRTQGFLFQTDLLCPWSYLSLSTSDFCFLSNIHSYRRQTKYASGHCSSSSC